MAKKKEKKIYKGLGAIGLVIFLIFLWFLITPVFTVDEIKEKLAEGFIFWISAFILSVLLALAIFGEDLVKKIVR